MAAIVPLTIALIATGERATRPSCRGNLRFIAMGLHLYADDNGGDFPPSLAELYPKYVESPSVFSCRAHPSHWQDFAAGSVGKESSSYVYLPGRSSGLPGPFVVAYDKPENHRNRGVNVLCLDSSTEWFSAERLPELWKTLAEQEAQLPKLRRNWEEQTKAAAQPLAPSP